MAELFGVQPPAVSKHLKNIFAEGESRRRKSGCFHFLEITTQHGYRRENAKDSDAILQPRRDHFAGYRVNSRRATRFTWATGVLKEFMIKGFALDDERLKNGRAFGKDFFRELLNARLIMPASVVSGCRSLIFLYQCRRLRP